MFKFKTVTLSDASEAEGPPRPMIKVSGPVEGDPARVKHMVFVIGQGQVTAHAHAEDWSAAGWNGQVSGEGFVAAPAIALGVAVNVIPGDVTAGALPSFESFSWAQQVEIT
jgi:hypothetical protein